MTDDLHLEDSYPTRQVALYQAIRKKIVTGLWAINGKLPSTRALASQLGISRNTVISAYEQLQSEGYIRSQPGAGYYVAIDRHDPYQQEKSSSAPYQEKPLSLSHGFAPGVADFEVFPYKLWRRILNHHLDRASLMGSQDLQGDPKLRQAIADYLASSRSVVCKPEQLIITSGAQQALTLAALAVHPKGQSIYLEEPGYRQMAKVLQCLGIARRSLRVDIKQGVQLENLENGRRDSVYITPSNQYPLGSSISLEKRLAILDWARKNGSLIIEDDYDSEFQFAHKPIPSLQGLAAQTCPDVDIAYVGSLSKVMFNSLRLGYLVVPEKFVSEVVSVKDALSGDTPAHTQAALAEFIQQGHLLRHIRKMRKLYEQKNQQMQSSIRKHLSSKVTIVSQFAGLHVTVVANHDINEQQLVLDADNLGIIIRPLSVYYNGKNKKKGIVLGYGNVALSEIDSKIAQIAKILTHV
ncbi:PLP-dependent aminotransferase family protein [Vibrio sp. SCSIO 43136]|uniref:MocR-like pyridoxine biosynthesis transcription factor PdxR n=1 Tax=Vibrio sp. SCSIO 43136 TaxID=2819101 RepID=UPI0020756B78|nr:PLP-dependent aminotransferase family protein [Vibrio sp. SCSIO 43136]USD67196.1 PLP-dependent aminotransferase family protein [Vibrio sp. SCSIO 43136]